MFASLDAAAAKKTTDNLFTEKRLLELYEEFWRADGYQDKKEREDYKKKGRESLKKFWASYQTQMAPDVLFLEKKFAFKLGSDSVKGTIDRVDKLADGSLEIIDYKTGRSKTKLEFKDKRQLILYQLFLEEFLQVKVSALSYYYLESGEKISFSPTVKDISKLREGIIKEIAAIKKREFTATPSNMCSYCDFREICEFRQP